MPTDRVLVEIVTVANLAGVEAAQKSFLGLSASTIALAAVLAVLIKVGQDSIQNSKAMEDANNQLTQAYATQHDTLAAHRAELETFLKTNERYISNQFDVLTGMAALIRAGHDETTSLRMLNDALDLAAIKHEDVSAAVNTLILAEAGNSRGLRDLGITTAEYNAIMKDKTIPLEQRNAELLALIETRTKNGRDATDHLTQSQNALNKEWQDFTIKIGPDLLIMWDKLNEAATTAIGLISVLLDLHEKLAALARQSLTTPTGQPPAASIARGAQGRSFGARAAGGPVGDGDYLVGEEGPEIRHFGAPGSIIPNGSGGGNHIHLHIGTLIGADGPGMDRLAREILQRARFAPGK